jgi:hypothetical protein
MVTMVAPQSYADPELGFALQYDASWHLEVRSGTALNDLSGRTILLEREGYQFRMMIRDRPHVVGECTGSLRQEDLGSYWRYRIDDREAWRAKAEAGFVNSYHDGQVAFIDIISPASLPDQTDKNGQAGLYTCSFDMDGRVLSVSYKLPVSVEDLKAGRYRADLLAEMDGILTSITWRQK